MTLQVINAGTVAGDHTGEDLHAAFTKVNSMMAELYALVGGGGSGYLATVITAASTNNYDPGSGFPTNIGRLDISPTTNDIILTGLIAGADGQPLTVRNIGSTYTIYLTNASSSSTAANRFDGESDAAIPPGGKSVLTYYSLPSPRWAIG